MNVFLIPPFTAVGALACIVFACADQALAQTFRRVADTDTSIPGGIGAFTSFDPQPSAHDVVGLTFRGFGGGGQEGIYGFHPATGVRRIADRNTLVPGTTATFQSFDTPAGMYFKAGSPTREGIYRMSIFPPNPIEAVDDSGGSYGRVSLGYGNASAYLRNGTVVFSTSGPGTPLNFQPPGFNLSGIGNPDIAPFDVAARANFVSSGGGGPMFGTGIFESRPFGNPVLVFSGPSGQVDEASAGLGGAIATVIRGGAEPGIHITSSLSGPARVVPPGTPIPGGTGGFTSFRTVSAGGAERNSPGQLAAVFLGEGAAGQEGIYWFGAGDIAKLIARGEMLDGRTVDRLTLGRDAATDYLVTFHATFTDGSAGIYQAVIPEPAGCLLATVWLFIMGRRRK